MNEPEEFPMPPESNNHSIQCVLDVGDCGLWLGTMNISQPLLRYNWYVLIVYYCICFKIVY